MSRLRPFHRRLPASPAVAFRPTLSSRSSVMGNPRCAIDCVFNVENFPLIDFRIHLEHSRLAEWLCLPASVTRCA